VQATRSDFTWHLQKKQLIFDPVEHVRNIFSPLDGSCRTSQLLNLKELPLLFVSAFFGLRADQPEFNPQLLSFRLSANRQFQTCNALFF
jgi:hypothetical protein